MAAARPFAPGIARVRKLAKASTRRKGYASTAASTIARDSKSGQFIGTIGYADAKRFAEANTALLEDIGRSKKAATAILKASGYLTREGKVSKRYR
jgi:hypothetical protein